MTFRVFIQSEAGSNRKHFHDEKSLEWKGVVEVSQRYPFPYGFVIGTTADDGCNVDCFVITDESLETGQVVECEIAGLMEQIEDEQEDHNVLATLPGASTEIGPSVRERLTEFVCEVFEHIDGKRIKVGRFLPANVAESYIKARLDETLSSAVQQPNGADAPGGPV